MTTMNDNKSRIIAFYLPQYHPTPDNDKWWGKGFTEWTNVGKAKPLFKGHYQPKVPADLGYYDLRLPQVREAQAELAKEAGIEGFCYYHYWFGDGKQELELPFNEVVRLGKPDFPFCLCWANESWHAKFWDNKGSAYSKKMLIEQRYLGHEDNVKHFYSLLSAFKDRRYMRIRGKLLFMIYQPFDFECVSEFIHDWQELAQENDLGGFYFIAQLNGAQQNLTQDKIDKALGLGFDGVNTVRLGCALSQKTLLKKIVQKLYRILNRMPVMTRYKDAYPAFIANEDRAANVYPTLIPNWDHTPRSGRNGYILEGSTPELFKKHIQDVLKVVRAKAKDDQIIFLKSWNEWGEGNYMEPDLKFGKGYIESLKSEIDSNA